MTSLALAEHVAPAFNTTFYATMAAVIPVLFLAIAAQGSAYWQFMNSTRGAVLIQQWSSTRRRRYQGCLSVVFILISLTVPVAGVIGEIATVLALDDRAAAPGTETPVLIATIYLLITAALGTVLQFLIGSEDTGQQEATPPAERGEVSPSTETSP
jgi:hypothetical protein